MRKNIFLTIVKVIFFIILGCILNFIVHELSHLLVIILCGGELDSISFGASSFVSGYVEEKYISAVALASIYIPTIVSVCQFIIYHFAFKKECSFSSLLCGFSVPTIMNTILGIYANLCIQDVEMRSTYDVALGIDNGGSKIFVFLISAIAFIINSVVIFQSL